MSFFQSSSGLAPCLLLPIMTTVACLDSAPELESSSAAQTVNVDMFHQYLPIVYGINGASGFYSTGTRIQNPGTRTATVRMFLYDEVANPVAVLRGPITSSASVTLFPLNILPTSWIVESSAFGFSLQTFGGSAVVESDQPVAAMVNLNSNCSNQACAMGSYNAFEAIDGDIFVPLVQRNNAKFTSWLAIQNASTESTAITIEFKPHSAGNPVTISNIFLFPGTAVQLSLDAVPGIGSTFIGSATVRSQQDFFGIRPALAVVANHEKHDGTANLHSLQSTRGFERVLATSRVGLPLVMANNGGFFTSPFIVNAGTFSTTIRVDYSPNQVPTSASTCATPPSKILSLAAGAALGYSTTGNEPGFVNCRYVGSARISSTSAPIVATVNEIQPGTSSTSEYEGIDLNDAVDTVSLPLVMANNGGFFTGVQIQNLATKAAQVTLKYEPNTFTGENRCAQPPSVTLTLQASSSMNFLQAGGFFATCRYVGSASVTAQNSDGSLGQLAVVVNEARLTPDLHQDALLTYAGRPNP